MKKVNTNIILVIEDDLESHQFVGEILNLSGYEVSQAMNGQEGIDLAFKIQPSLILCDIRMSEIDGYGVLCKLKQSSETSNIPFIFMTSLALREDFRRGMEMGADDFLSKPFTQRELLNAVQIRLKIKAQQRTDFQKLNLNVPEPYTPKKSSLEISLIALKQLLLSKNKRNFKKNQAIFYEGDPSKGLYLVLEGKVKTIKIEESGLELITSIYNKGEYLSFLTVLGIEEHSETAIAIEDSQLFFLPKVELELFVNSYPIITQFFIKLLSKNIKDKENQLLELAYHRVKKRVAESLIRLHQQSNASGASFHISREDLSAMSGVAGETISRTLKILKEESLIEKKGDLITLLNIEKLQKIKN